jgi:hypothetical protein
MDRQLDVALSWLTKHDTQEVLEQLTRSPFSVVCIAGLLVFQLLLAQYTFSYEYKCA